MTGTPTELVWARDPDARHVWRAGPYVVECVQRGRYDVFFVPDDAGQAGRLNASRCGTAEEAMRLAQDHADGSGSAAAVEASLARPPRMPPGIGEGASCPPPRSAAEFHERVARLVRANGVNVLNHPDAGDKLAALGLDRAAVWPDDIERADREIRRRAAECREAAAAPPGTNHVKGGGAMRVRESEARQMFRAMGFAESDWSRRRLETKLNALAELSAPVGATPKGADLKLLRSVLTAIKVGERIELEEEKEAAEASPQRDALKRVRDSVHARAAEGAARGLGKGGMSLAEAAAKVLSRTRRPLSSQEIVRYMEQYGYWKSASGKTPDATVRAVLNTEIARRGADSRFAKEGRHFTVRGSGG